MINLKLKKYFEEPKNKYICFTTSLFEKKKYIKDTLSTSYNKIVKKDISKKIINNLFKNLTKISNSLINGYYPDNFYLRLYYNDKIIKNKNIMIY